MRREKFNYDGEIEIERNKTVYTFQVDYSTTIEIEDSTRDHPTFGHTGNQDLDVEYGYYYDDNNDEVRLTKNEIKKFIDEITELADELAQNK